MLRENLALQETMMSLLWLCPYEQRRKIFKTLSPGWYRYFQRMREIETERGRSLKPFDDHRCIFVHITKCAGVSVATSLFGNLGGAHLRLAHYQLIFNRREFEEYYKFTFVRNPWDRLLSAFRFLKKGGVNDADRKWAAQNLSGYADFDAFVRHWVNRRNVNRWKHFVPQYKFLCEPGSRRPAVDFVGRFESLQDDFAKIEGRVGSRSGLRHLNRTGEEKRDFREYYTEASRDIVAEVYQEDIEIFGYDFDNSRVETRTGAYRAGRET